MAFTLEEKLIELDREIALRHRVYPWMIRRRKIKKEDAIRQLAILNAVARTIATRSRKVRCFVTRRRDPR